MSSGSNETLPAITQEKLQRLLLARMRFERAMGLEFVSRGAVIQRRAQVQSNAPAGENSSLSTPLSAPELRASELTKPKNVTAISIEASVAVSTPVQIAMTAPAPIASKPTPEDKAAHWRNLEDRAMGCVQCVLHTTRKNVVFGAGNRAAELVFVGEGPGADEDEKGLPFVGKAGELLTKIITAAMGLKREDVFICNVVKCRPPGNRNPEPAEVAACSPFLFEQLELISPKVIVTLGVHATRTLLNTTQGIMRIRGTWQRWRGIPVMPTYHPAFLLYQYTQENRRAVWDDMIQVLERLKQKD